MIITDEAQLRVECKDVSPDEVDFLRGKLEEELQLSCDRGRPGIGLACPQIGIAKNMAIIRVIGRNGNAYNVDLVNAKIKKGYNKSLFEKEGCLSFPGKFVKTERFQEIYVTDNLVEPYSFIATGLFAVCIQHELDHLRGVLLPDLDINRVSNDRIRGKTEFAKIIN